MRVTITPIILADWLKDGNELHVKIKSPITKNHVYIGVQINKAGNIELLFEDQRDQPEPVTVETLPQD